MWDKLTIIYEEVEDPREGSHQRHYLRCLDIVFAAGDDIDEFFDTLELPPLVDLRMHIQWIGYHKRAKGGLYCVCLDRRRCKE